MKKSFDIILKILYYVFTIFYFDNILMLLLEKSG